MTTLIGSSTAIVRGAIAFRCSRTQNSSRLYSTRFSARVHRYFNPSVESTGTE